MTPEAFDSILCEKMERILTQYSLPKETDTATLMSDETMKAMVQSLDCLTDI